MNMAGEMALMVSTQRTYQLTSTAIQTESQMMSIANQLRRVMSIPASACHDRRAGGQPGARAGVGARRLCRHAEGLRRARCPSNRRSSNSSRSRSPARAASAANPPRRRSGRRRRRLLEGRRGASSPRCCRRRSRAGVMSAGGLGLAAQLTRDWRPRRAQRARRAPAPAARRHRRPASQSVPAASGLTSPGAAMGATGGAAAADTEARGA